MFKRIGTVLAVACLTLATYAVAQEMTPGHPETYVVRKGDTLWDISARFLKKPWLWPEIWQANPQIQNPHLIYPGDVISLAYLDRVTVQQGPREEAPVTGLPLSEVEPFLKNLRVVDSFEQLPYVAGLEEDRLRAIGNQRVYVLGLEAPQVGQRYAIVRPTALNAEPRPRDLDRRGRTLAGEANLWAETETPNPRKEVLGYELAQVAVGQVTAAGTGEQVSTLAMEGDGIEVRAGDRVIPVEAQPYDLQFFPHPPKVEAEPGKLRILAVSDSVGYGGTRDVVAISGGSREGLDNGTVLSVWRQGSYVLDPTRRGSTSRYQDSRKPGTGRNAMPDEYASHVMIFRTFDKVSYGLIMEGSQPTRVGYALRHPDATH